MEEKTAVLEEVLSASAQLSPSDQLRLEAYCPNDFAAFVTNDRRLAKIQELQVALPDDYVVPQHRHGPSY